MKSQSLTVIAGFMFIVSVVAWFTNLSRPIDYMFLFVLSILFSAVAARVGDLEKRLVKLEGSMKS